MLFYVVVFFLDYIVGLICTYLSQNVPPSSHSVFFSLAEEDSFFISIRLSKKAVLRDVLFFSFFTEIRDNLKVRHDEEKIDNPLKILRGREKYAFAI